MLEENHGEMEKDITQIYE